MLLRARWLLPMSAPPLRDGAVLVRAGRISALGPAEDVIRQHPETSVTDFGEAALMPGLVNAHSHLELGLLGGLLGGLAFFPWIRQVVAIQRERFEPGDHALASLAGAAECLRSGVTFVADCSATGAPAAALAQSGLRGRVHQEVFAPDASWLSWALPELERRLEALAAQASPRVRIGLSPHSPYMAGPALLDVAARLASDRDLPLSIHLAESRDEDDFIRSASGPLARHFRERGFRVEARGRSPVEHVAAHGLLALPVPTQLVHLCHAREDDLDLIARARRGGGRIGLAACPRSNARLGHRAPDVAGWTRRGLPWGFGTDGLSSAPSLHLLEEARALPAGDAMACLARATREAARSLGLDREIGAIEPGLCADLVAWRVPAERGSTAQDAAAWIASAARPRDVAMTMVDGRVLFDGDRLTTLDEAALRSRFIARAEALGARRAEITAWASPAP